MKRDGLAGFIRDNLEAFAVAIAMALVIRHFCIEAFRIPTRSMVPTLLGDEPPNHGDRILVDKFVYLRRDPRRWEVVVFQYPLNRNRNFIKRLIGLPGEILRIVDGDIWTSRDGGETWAIQRKPRGVREQLLFPYYPVASTDPDYFASRDNWNRDLGWEISERSRRFQVDTEETADLRFRPHVSAYPRVDGGRPFVGDVRIRFDLAVKRAGRLAVLLQEHGFKHRLVLGSDRSYAVVVRPDGEGGVREHEFPIDVKLAEGMELSVSFANVDNMLHVEIEGDADVQRDIEFPDPSHEPEDPDVGSPNFPGDRAGDQQITLSATRLSATITDIDLARDLYYSSNHPMPLKEWRIPEGHFFMMGDNTEESKDSRAWKIVKAILKDGSEVLWEAAESDVPGQPPARLADGGDEAVIRVAADVDGLVRYIRNGDVADFETGIEWPYVSRDHLVGRAFAIFWPIYIPPAYRGPTRVNLIH